SLHELHGKPRAAVGSHATVEEPSNVGMIERGKNFPLLGEPPGELAIESRSGADQLEGNLHGGPVPFALREIDSAHASVACFPHDQVWPHPHPAGGGRYLIFEMSHKGRRVLRRWLLEKVDCLIAVAQEQLDVGSERRIAGAGLLEIGAALSGLEIQQLVEQSADLGPAV